MALQWLDGSVEFQQKHEREDILPKSLKAVFVTENMQKSGGKQSLVTLYRALGPLGVCVDRFGW